MRKDRKGSLGSERRRGRASEIEGGYVVRLLCLRRRLRAIATGWSKGAARAWRTIGGSEAAAAGAAAGAAGRPAAAAEEMLAVVHSLELAAEFFSFFTVELLAAGIVGF